MAVYALRIDLASKVAIRYSAHMYQLTPELEVIADVREFDAALADARGASGGALIESLARAVDLYKGPLLANAGWDWLESVRLEYQERYVGAALQLADILALTDLERSDTLAANVLAAAPETELAYERLLLNAAARQDVNAVRRIRSRYEQAAARYGFRPSSHFGAGSSIRARASR
jgi:two-component SAPR family response regulator